MKCIIAGSRTITDKKEVFKALKDSGIKPSEITEIVSGCARGVDTLGEEIAKSKKIPVKQFPADWKRDGKKAGIIRNTMMSRYSDVLIAVWDGTSNGTRHMIEVMKKADKPVHIHIVAPNYYICNVNKMVEHCRTACVHGMKPHRADECTKKEFCSITNKIVKCRKISLNEIRLREKEWCWE